MSQRFTALAAGVLLAATAIGVSACARARQPVPTPLPTSTAPSPPSTPPPGSGLPAIPVRDCIGHNPSQLTIVSDGALGWQIIDSGSHAMLLLDTAADAEKALTLARSYHTHCFLGRGNTRTDRKRYIFEYWMNPDNATVSISSPDCLRYDPATVRYEAYGDAWRLLSNAPGGASMAMNLLDTEQDAADAVIVAKHYTNQCFIGRDNTRADRVTYIVMYWQ
jgi:hypothetical protein